MINKSLLKTLSGSLLLTYGITASATNGYFTHGTGTINKGLAGAGLAAPSGSIFIANNPASALVGTGQLDIGGSLFNPNRSYSSSSSQANGNGGAFTIGPNNLDSDRELFLIPYVAYGWQLDDSSAIGAAFYGRGGMNTQWKGGTASFDPDGPGPTDVSTLPGTFGAGKTGIDLAQAFIDLAYARKATDRFNWGVSGVFAIQAFEATGLDNFAPFTESFAASGGTAFPSNLSNNGSEISTGFGIKIGFQTSLSDTISLAAAYQSKISMSEFDDYSDLFAEGGGFDIPANAKIGLSFKPSSQLTLSFDVDHTQFSSVDSVGNPFSNLLSCPTVDQSSTALANCLGGSNGPGFGWDDMTVVKVGAEWNTGSEWIWRAGYSHGAQPIPDSEVLFNILAPGVIEDHISFGFSRAIGNSGKLNFALTHALNNSVSGTNPLDPTQTIKLEMHQFDVELGYTWLLR